MQLLGHVSIASSLHWGFPPSSRITRAFSPNSSISNTSGQSSTQLSHPTQHSSSSTTRLAMDRSFFAALILRHRNHRRVRRHQTGIFELLWQMVFLMFIACDPIDVLKVDLTFDDGPSQSGRIVSISTKRFIVCLEAISKSIYPLRYPFVLRYRSTNGRSAAFTPFDTSGQASIPQGERWQF
jgi:hypothetical protein